MKDSIRKDNLISYFLLLFVNSASAQYFYLPVYFEYYLNDAEYAFLFSTINVTLRAIISPFAAELLKNKPKLMVSLAFAYQVVFSLILFYKLLPPNLLVIVVIATINAVATSLLLFLNAIFFSYSEPTIFSRYQRANVFISSKFTGYVVGSVVSILILFFLNSIHFLFLASATIWLISIPIIFTLHTRNARINKPNILEIKRVFTNFSPLLLLSFMFSMSLATMGGLMEPLIFNNINAVGWFSISFILANVLGSIVPLYFPKSKAFIGIVFGMTVSTLTEFLFPITPQLYLLVIYGVLSQVGNSLVWPAMIAKIMSRSEYPVLESGILTTITDMSTLIANSFAVLLFPEFNVFTLSLFSVINLAVWIIYFLKEKTVLEDKPG
ncbi:hypothetical protein [Sulfolobus acidocaldarius]|uniref:Conserved membrane protein n=4 Tax=Sulfolobus acidocaldarius TaxID=2285 RepID=Q4JAW8_SULAC|nr:hypothetical protein [Sulfolobus acidocaldarius]AAY80061.1 conserved membrane protein [Sulfolobus acidocaldarius DSM 639]